MGEMPSLPKPVLSLAEVERRHILQTLALCKYNRTHAATLLGISIRCLRLKLHEYNLSDLIHEPPPPKLEEHTP
jgi:two-component system response regulator FlrC